MTGKKCEVCGREIENPTNRQRFCKECAKKRQAEAFHRYYLANREYYAERSKEQSTRRKQSRLEELLAGEPRPFKPPKYTIEQVNNRLSPSASATAGARICFRSEKFVWNERRALI